MLGWPLMWGALLLCLVWAPLTQWLRHLMGWQLSWDDFFMWRLTPPTGIVLVGFEPETREQWMQVAHRRGVNIRTLDSSGAADTRPGDVVVCASREAAATRRAAAPDAFLFSCSDDHGGIFWDPCDGAVSKNAEVGVDEAIRLYGRVFEGCQVHIETIRRLGKIIDPLDGIVLVENGRGIVPLLISASLPIDPVPSRWYFRCDEVCRHFAENVNSAERASAIGELVDGCQALHAISTECLKRLMLHLRNNKSLSAAISERGAVCS